METDRMMQLSTVLAHWAAPCVPASCGAGTRRATELRRSGARGTGNTITLLFTCTPL